MERNTFHQAPFPFSVFQTIQKMESNSSSIYSILFHHSKHSLSALIELEVSLSLFFFMIISFRTQVIFLNLILLLVAAGSTTVLLDQLIKMFCFWKNQMKMFTLV